MYKTFGGAALPEPLRVSPLIRVARWTFLGLGIVWGIRRFSVLQKKENNLREIRERERPARQAAKAAIKDKIFKEQEAELMAAEKGGAK